MRGATLAVLLAVVSAACTSGPVRGQSLSFAQMQSLNRGVNGEWILEEYPFASGVERGPDGRLRAARYSVEDAQGKTHRLDLEFDATGTLARKRYSGPIVRPPRPPGPPE